MFRSSGSSGHITLEGVNQAPHKSGIPKGQMCNHGWRAVMLTLGHNYCTVYEAVELSASHEIGNAVAQAYNRGNYEEGLALKKVPALAKACFPRVQVRDVPVPACGLRGNLRATGGKSGTSE